MVNVLVINNAEMGITEFIEPFYEISEQAGVHMNTFEYKEISKINLSQYDGAILSGSPRGDDIVDHHLPFFKWIESYQKPILGICAGHHIIGKIFGSTLIRTIETEIGDHTVYIDKEDSIFEACSNPMIVRQEHHDSITLPEDFEKLAHSDMCQVQVIKHKTKPIYSTQFHPEILNKRLVLNFIEVIKDHLCQVPISTL
jgi:GMP synthase (glutamine-hydrolysing)